MSDELIKGIADQISHGKSPEDVAAGVRQLIDALERLTQFAQNAAGQVVAPTIQSALEAYMTSGGGGSGNTVLHFGEEEAAAIAHARLARIGQIGQGLKTREGQTALEENDQAKERDLADGLRAKQIRRKKFDEEDAPLLEAQQKLNEGDERGAKALEDKAAWMRTYNELLKNGAEEWQAQQGASATLFTQQKAEQEKHAQSYAHLVTARDGAADTARVATAAHDDVLRHTGSSALDQLRHDMNRNHAEAHRTATRKNYSRL